jgi:hypothetical protein
MQGYMTAEGSYWSAPEGQLLGELQRCSHWTVQIGTRGGSSRWTAYCESGVTAAVGQGQFRNPGRQMFAVGIQ